MTAHPITIGRHVLAVEALRVMEQRSITAVVVVGPARRGWRASCICTTCGVPQMV